MNDPSQTSILVNQWVTGRNFFLKAYFRQKNHKKIAKKLPNMSQIRGTFFNVVYVWVLGPILDPNLINGWVIVSFPSGRLPKKS